MRGVDYRSTSGVTLIMAKQVAGIREQTQALSRVGRGGDRCNRFKLFDKLVNPAFEAVKNA